MTLPYKIYETHKLNRRSQSHLSTWQRYFCEIH